ncbi:MAG: hypothetical protein JNL80_16695 [Phycisphaerae bacterium]|nr:hypothetical protein [Phycisphaerae bacterium]
MGMLIQLLLRWVGGLLVLSALAGRPAAALAQGYGALVPEPIRLGEIGTWFETRLDRRVDTGECKKVIAAHAAYWAEYRALAEREFDRLLATEQGAWREPSKLPERARRIAAAVRKIDEIDRALFDAIEAAIPEGDRPAFASARLARSIVRLQSTDRFGLGAEGQSATIVEEILQLRHLPAETLRTIRPALLPHEARIESLLREAQAASERFQDRLAEAAARRVAAGESVVAAYGPARADAVASLGDWTAPHRRLVAAIGACRAEFNRAVDFDVAREFAWTRFGRRNQQSDLFFDTMMVERHFRLALREAKDEASVADLRAAYVQWAKDDDAFIDRVLERLVDPDQAQEILGNTMPIRKERQVIGSKALSRIRSILPDRPSPDDRFMRADIFVRASSADRTDPDSESELLGLVTAEALRGSSATASRWRMNWRPLPLEADAVLAWFEDASDAERATVRHVLADATKRWEETIALPFNELAERQRAALSQIYGEASKAQLGEEVGERAGREAFVAFGEESVALFDRIAAFDQTLFDEVATVLGLQTETESPARRTALDVALALARCERALATWADSEELLGVSSSHEVLPNLPTLLRTSVPLEHRARVGAAIAADAQTWIAMARERRVGRARGDVIGDWVRAEAMLRQSELQQRQNAGDSPEAIQKAWHELTAWRQEQGELGEGASDRAMAYRTQSTRWRERFTAVLDELTAATEGRFTADQRLAVEIGYERMVAPNRFHEIRDPSGLFRQAEGLVREDEPRRAAVSGLAAESARSIDRWTLDRLAAMRRHDLAQTSDSSGDLGAGISELRFRLDRIERHTATTWRLIGLLTPDELNRLPALREYDRLCVLSGMSWWNE